MQPSRKRWPPVLHGHPCAQSESRQPLEHPRVVQGCQLRAGHLPLDRLLLVDIQHHHLRHTTWSPSFLVLILIQAES